MTTTGMTMNTRNITATPLAAPFGAELSGVDLSRPLDAPTVAAIRKALDDHQLVVFRGQQISAPELVTFSRHFGDIALSAHKYSHPDAPEAYVISNIVDERGENIGLAEAGPAWHTDGVYFEKPHAYTLFYAVEVPHDNETALGDTQFASAANACDALSAADREHIARLRAVHSITRPRQAERLGTRKRKPLTPEQLAKNPDRDHPVVRTHPRTGRKCIFVNETYTERIVDMPESESRALLDRLQAHIVSRDFYYRHSWKVGDLVICDNCALQHKSTLDYTLPRRRMLYRTTVKGEVPV